MIKAGEWIIAQLVAAYNNRGVALRPNGELDRAIEDYDQAIRLMPDYYVAINNCGVALMAGGELDRAIADFDRVIQLKPEIHQESRIDALIVLNDASSFARDGQLLVHSG